MINENIINQYELISDEELENITGSFNGWYFVGYVLGVTAGTVWNYRGFPTK